MAVYDTMSKREKRSESDGSDVLIYDDIDEVLRGQVCLLLTSAFGTTFETDNTPWRDIHNIVAGEVGRSRLYKSEVYSPNLDLQRDLLNYLKQCDTTEFLDALDIAFNYIDTKLRERFQNRNAVSKGRLLTADEAIADLNARLREHSMGYRYDAGHIVKISSTYIHDAVTVPVLVLLRGMGFDGADDEFREALKHFRHGDFKSTVVSAGNAVESTMKTICSRRGRTDMQNKTAAPLMDAIWGLGFIPDHLNERGTGLKSTFEGFFAIRNKSRSAHGSGELPEEVPEQIAAYALHLAASCILFLIQQHRAVPQVLSSGVSVASVA